MGESAEKPEDLTIKKNIHSLPSSYSDNSLHELDEFHDPFSDISLFLSEKITTEITAHGSTQEWSAQIEQDLLRKILPEFKARFPRYRLGLFALKKAFEKVAYFYEKLYGHKNLDANTLIRENLRNQLEIGIYNSIKAQSEQIAQNVGECLATLQGRKPNLVGLMAKTYSGLKALFSEVPPQNPFYSCDARDALIVKTQIETISDYPEITFYQLQAVIEQKLSMLYEIPAPHKNNKLEIAIACHLGTKWSATLKAKLCENELHLLKELVQKEAEEGNSPSKIARHFEMIVLMAKSCYGDHPPSQLLDLYQNEILLEFEEYGHSETQHQIEQVSNLTRFLSLTASDTKALIWALIAELQIPSSPILSDLIDSELVSVIRNSNIEEFWALVQKTLLHFKKAKESLENQEGLEEKIEFWALQNELVLLELNLPEPQAKKLPTQFLSFADEIKKREWIYERYRNYRKADGTPLERYKALNPDLSLSDRLPLLP
ncbi:MAG: hypothetical protein SNF33_07115 [Candidatus Algichlamydia australiensis]|nr:hypothetical protein [Chlamydiales bacterium]